MSKADEIFEKLEKINFRVIRNDEVIWYQKNKGNKFYDIIFDLKQKIVSCELSTYNEKGTLIKKEGIMNAEISELIYKEVKELGWLDDK